MILWLQGQHEDAGLAQAAEDGVDDNAEDKDEKGILILYTLEIVVLDQASGQKEELTFDLSLVYSFC